MPEDHPRACDEALLAQARAAILAEQNPSVAFLQRRFRLGYQQALALMQGLENDVVTAPGADGWRRMLDSGRRSPDSPCLEGGLSMSESVIDPDTIRAYLETEYRVFGDTPATLRVGSPCPDLLALHQAHRVDCSAFITACNPFSLTLDEATNAARQRALARELAQRGLTFIEGVGQHPSNQWPGEASFLVLGLALESAKTLGTQLAQNAIAWSGPDAVPRLVLLR